MDNKLVISVDFSNNPELLTAIKKFAKREFLDTECAIRRIVGIALKYNFNVGEEVGDPYPFILEGK